MSILKNGKGIIIILLVCIFLEGVIFNINSFRLLGKNYNKQEINIEDTRIAGARMQEDGSYIVTENIMEIEILGINEEVGTLKVDTTNNTDDGRFMMTIAYTDETTKTYDNILEELKVNANLLRKENFTMRLTGNVENLKLRLYGLNDKTVNINEITINEPIKYNFNIIRFLIVFMVIFSIYAVFRYKTFEEIYSLKNPKQKVILIGITCIFIIICMKYVDFNFVKGGTTVSYEQDYIKALAKGQLHLDIEPSQKLLDMENPYDGITRTREVPEALYDIAFYNGKYYIYFSIIPALTLGLPIYLLTSTFLSMSYMIVLYAILGTIFTVLLISEIVKRWFSNTSFRMVVFAIVSVLFANVILYTVATPLVYELVSILGYWLVMQGIYFLLKATKNMDNIKIKYIVASCISIALSVNARPNLILISLFIAPILIKILLDFIKKKNNKRTIQYILAVAIPYLIIGVAIMILNYVRFGSITEFGAVYQLTSNDMAKLGYRLSTIPLGIWHYLFAMPTMSFLFPYFKTNISIPRYMGFYGKGYSGAGIFTTNPLMCMLFFLPVLKGTIKEKYKGLWGLLLLSIAIGVLMIITVTLVGASYIRYALDFAWLFTIPSVLVMIIIYEEIKNKEIIKKMFEYLIIVLVLISIVINLSIGLTSEKGFFRTAKPIVYDSIESMMSFWE